MFSFLIKPPHLWLLIALCAVNLIYFIMMTPKFNLHLGVFLGVSIFFTLGFLISFYIFATLWNGIGIIICLLYDAGSIVHLIKGKRYVKEITGK